VSARLNAMCQADRDIEDRIFEGYRLIAKVIGERDTPNGIRIREGIERFAAIRI